MTGAGAAAGGSGVAGVITKASPAGVGDTVATFVDLLGAHGVKVFAVIDQRAEARTVGLDLRETVLVIFGNPKAGTPVMAASPLAALDLPLKVLVWADPDRGTLVSYTDPDALVARYGLSAELKPALAAVNVLTDALVAS